MMLEEVRISRLDAGQTREIADELGALFVEVFDTPERHGDAFFKEEKFLERLHAYTNRAGYELVAARLDGHLIGYMSGFSLPPDTGWWNGLEPPRPSSELAETGRRTFAINELAVQEKHRERGIGGQLIQELLGARAEERATFLTEPHNALLQSLAGRYGWSKIGEQRPFPDAPVLYVYVRTLPI